MLKTSESLASWWSSPLRWETEAGRLGDIPLALGPVTALVGHCWRERPDCRGGAGEHLMADVPHLPTQAHDDDQPDTNNSLLHFSLLPSSYSHNFSVDPDKGILTNLGPLDREAIDPTLGGRIVLTVRVSDCGVPALWTDVNVTITVEVRLSSAGGSRMLRSYVAGEGVGEGWRDSRAVANSCLLPT